MKQHRLSKCKKIRHHLKNAKEKKPASPADQLTEKEIIALMRHDSYRRNCRGAITNRNSGRKVVK